MDTEPNLNNFGLPPTSPPQTADPFRLINQTIREVVDRYKINPVQVPTEFIDKFFMTLLVRQPKTFEADLTESKKWAFNGSESPSEFWKFLDQYFFPDEVREKYVTEDPEYKPKNPPYQTIDPEEISRPGEVREGTSVKDILENLTFPISPDALMKKEGRLRISYPELKGYYDRVKGLSVFKYLANECHAPFEAEVYKFFFDHTDKKMAEKFRSYYHCGLEWPHRELGVPLSKIKRAVSNLKRRKVLILTRREDPRIPRCATYLVATSILQMLRWRTVPPGRKPGRIDQKGG